MRTFKLIQWYPGSPPTGTIVETHGQVYRELKQRGTSKYRAVYRSSLIEESPRHWLDITEVPKELNYKILILKSNGGHTMNAPFFDINNMLTEQECTIYSVKRLSDNKIFRVNDVIISKFIDSGTDIKPDFKSVEISSIHIGEGGIYFKTSLCNIRLINAKLINPPLFITEDGIQIFRGDQYTFLRNSNTEYTTCFAGNTVDSAFIEKDETVLKFSSEEKAEEFIILNKPCLSYSEIEPYLRIRDCNKVLQLLKNKI